MSGNSIRALWLGLALLLVAVKPGAQPTLTLPPRPSNVADIVNLLQTLGETSSTARQRLMEREVFRGNIPDFLRTFKPVSWDAVTSTADGTLRASRVTIYVLPDYLAIGSDSSYLRISFMPHFAQRIANETGCILPTTLMVDKIYQGSTCKLAPLPFSPKEFDISHLSTWKLNSEGIDDQLAKAGRGPGEVVTGGIKKDVVITNRLAEPARSPRVSIYGWHRLDGAPIQPLTLVHAATYVDYSHGTRLVSNTMKLDGETTSVKSILQDPHYWPLLSREGQMTSATIAYPVPLEPLIE